MNETAGRSTDSRLETALQEYLDRIDRGEVVEQESFLADYPEIADGLRNLIAAEEQLRKLAGDKASRESASTQSFAAQGQETVLTNSQLSETTGKEGLQGQFGRYEILRLLGKGAMGSVYLAHDTQLKRPVALKTPHFKDDPTGELLKRFYREAESAATLRHANICPVYDVGQIDGRHFISMAFIEGRTLRDVIDSGPEQSERQAAIAVYKLARALQEAHDQGIVHRDLKPANIMVGKQGEPIIMDFGLARTRPAEGEASLTQSGVILGSPAYMSPEQVEGEPDSVGPGSDQYSLGVVLYEMLTGRLPFRGSIANVLTQILTRGVTPPSELRPGLDPRLETICLRMMAKRASDRFPSMKVVAEELSRVIKNPAATSQIAEQAGLPDAASLEEKDKIPAAPASNFTRSGRGPRWIRWSILAGGLALIIGMYALVVIYLGKTAIVFDIQDASIEVTVKGNTATITGPHQQPVKVTPGEQELVITSPNLETITRSFSLKKGETKTVTVSIVDRKIVARLENEPLPDPAVGGTTAHNAAAQPRSFKPYLVRGNWKIENDELVQPALTSGYLIDFDNPQIFPLILFGDDALSDYDLTLDVKKTGGNDLIGVFFHWLGRGHCRCVQFERNQGLYDPCFVDGKWSRTDAEWKPCEYTSNRWYTLKVQTRGSTFRVYVDNDLQFERTDERFTHGWIGLYTWVATARFRRIKVTDARGNVLFEGLPQLPSADDAHGLPPRLSETARPLTVEETAAKRNQHEHAKTLNTPIVSTNSIGMKLALIPPAEFQMGVSGAQGTNALPHRVRVTKPFYLGAYEVTQRECEMVLNRNPSLFRNCGDESERTTGVETRQYPVEQTTWYDAIEFCNTLSEREGQRPCYLIDEIERDPNGEIIKAKVSIVDGDGYRLPTEAEWEYACRAGTTTLYNFGAANNGLDCNCDGRTPDGTNVKGPWLGQTIPVGRYRPNAFGLYDMHGNASEWCWDLFDADYYERSPLSDPMGPASGKERVVRGGVYSYIAVYSRSAHRAALPPGYYTPGFRVARDVAAPADADAAKPAPPNADD